MCLSTPLHGDPWRRWSCLARVWEEGSHPTRLYAIISSWTNGNPWRRRSCVLVSARALTRHGWVRSLVKTEEIAPRGVGREPSQTRAHDLSTRYVSCSARCQVRALAHKYKLKPFAARDHHAAAASTSIAEDGTGRQCRRSNRTGRQGQRQAHRGGMAASEGCGRHCCQVVMHRQYRVYEELALIACLGQSP